MEPKIISESAIAIDPTSQPQPPVAPRRPIERRLHGDLRIDDYAWLREKDNPEVIRHLEAENAYTSAILKPTEAFQETLYQEMLSRIQQTDLTVPYLLRGFLYFSKTIEGQQYSLHYRRLAADDSASDRLLLDLNALASGHTFLGLDVFAVSEDNNLLAYSTDVTGFRQYTLQIKDLTSGELLPFRGERVTSAAWSADSRYLFYVVEDPVTKRSHRLFRHDLRSAAGGDFPSDPLLYEEGDERFRIDIERTRSGAYLLLVSNSHTTSEVRYVLASTPLGEFHLVAPREDNHEYYVEHHPSFVCAGADLDGNAGDVFLIRTNSGGRTYRLAAAPASSPARENWREVIPNRPPVMLAAVDAFRSHLVLFERENGLPFLRVVPITQPVDVSPATETSGLPTRPRQAASPTFDLLADSYRIPFSESAYNAAPGNNPEFGQSRFRYTYESFITPRSVFDFDFGAHQSILRKQQPVLGGYDPTRYATERLHATASDGTRIPISVVYRRDVAQDGTTALLLYGYGSYGISMPVNFNSNRLSLLDRGVAFAIAHIRGGGELGKPWHDAGRMHQKRNTFADFICSAEFLIANQYTSAHKLVIQGGSAGGLLMGAVTNLRPDLIHAVISQVPFVDVLNTMLDPSLPLTVGEYEEWGNPNTAEDYFYMKSYCPYTNLGRKAYPAMLLKTGLNDSQVMYWEPAKYVAKLRTLKTDSSVLLFKINMGAGHGGASGRYDYLREIALDYAFLLAELGIRP